MIATFPTALLPILIFLLRLGDMSLDTLRVLFVVRGQRKFAWILGFFQSLIWVLAITSVLSNLNNPLNILGYASGFATGNVVGMVIEERLAIGYGHLRIMSGTRGSAIAQALREAGYAATELAGRGRDGTVAVIHSSVRRREIRSVEDKVRSIDPEAFITVQEVRPLQRGFWRA